MALIVGYPCFRFRITGHYFVLVTLALSGIVLQVITATRDYTGGSLGYTPNRASGNKLLALQFDDKTTWYLIALGVWLFGIVVWHWVDRSMSRYALEAISEDEDAAAAAGVDVTAEKLKITLLSALMTALAGAIYCQYQMFITPTRSAASRCRSRWCLPPSSAACSSPSVRPSVPSSRSCWRRACASASAPRRSAGTISSTACCWCFSSYSFPRVSLVACSTD
ncbi:ABC-type Fe3+-siderophore transport system permease subunit [Bradyrhizobium diazoefficiens]